MLKNFTGKDITFQRQDGSRFVLKAELTEPVTRMDRVVKEEIDGIIVYNGAEIHNDVIYSMCDRIIVNPEVYVEMVRRGQKNVLMLDSRTAVRNAMGGIHAYTQLISP